jgi:predicted RNase H-like HicB family nuclease
MAAMRTEKRGWKSSARSAEKQEGPAFTIARTGQFPAMARPIRREFPGAVYHLTARPDRQEDIFPDDNREHVYLAPVGLRWHDDPYWAAECGEMRFNVTIDRDEDGVWVVECPAIPGCVSQGTTKDEALDNIAEAIKLCLEVRAEHGLPLTIETRQIDVAA